MAKANLECDFKNSKEFLCYGEIENQAMIKNKQNLAVKISGLAKQITWSAEEVEQRNLPFMKSTIGYYHWFLTLRDERT